MTYEMLPIALINPFWFLQLLYFDQEDNGGLSLALQVYFVVDPFYIGLLVSKTRTLHSIRNIQYESIEYVYPLFQAL